MDSEKQKTKKNGRDMDERFSEYSTDKNENDCLLYDD